MLAWAKELAGEGGTAIGFPVEYGGEGEVGALDRRVRDARVRRPLAAGEVRRPVRPVRRRGAAPRHRAPPRAPPVRRSPALELPGCFAMTETGHGSNVQALAHDRDLRRRRAASSSSTRRTRTRARTTSATPRATGAWPRCSPSSIVGGEARGVHALLVPLRDEDGAVLPGVTIEDCGAEARPRRRRQRPDRVRPRPRPARRRCSTATRQVARRRHLRQPDREPDEALLRDARHADPGPRRASAARRSPRRRSRSTSRSGTRSPRRQFGPPGGEEVLLLDYRTHQRRLLPALATTYGLHFAQERLVAQLHEVFTAPTTCRDRKRRELETLAAGLKAVASWHATDTIQTCREACGGAGYLREQPLRRAEGRHRRLHDVRGRQHRPAPARGEEPADRLPRPVRRAGPARPRDVRRRPGASARSPSAPPCARCSPAGAASPGRDDGRAARPRRAARRCCAGARSTSSQGVARRLKGGIDGGRDAVRRARRLPGPRRRGRARVGRPRRAGGVRRRASSAARTPRCAPVLDRLCSLYALARIEAERGWYQEHGRLSARALEGGHQGRQRAVRRAAARRGAARRRRSACPSRPAERRPRADARARGMSRLPRAERERQMLAAARTLFAERGFAAVTMDEVAAARRRHQAAALHVLRQQGAAVPRVHGARRRGARRHRRGRRARHRDAGRRAARRRARVLRVRRRATAARGGSCSTRRCPPARSRPAARPRSASG